jgi:hypothetical protein
MDVPAIGVAGVSQVKPGRDRTTAGGVGIVGASESGQGFEVMGLSVDDLTKIHPSNVPRTLDKADGSGTGVLGASGKGVGVHGRSLQGRGGKFESQQAAQVRLVPVELLTPQGNLAGQAGDLLVTKKGAEPCNLWFCARGGIESVAQWVRIV